MRGIHENNIKFRATFIIFISMNPMMISLNTVLKNRLRIIAGSKKPVYNLRIRYFVVFATVNHV
jgi:hypothetical protein